MIVPVAALISRCACRQRFRPRYSTNAGSDSISESVLATAPGSSVSWAMLATLPAPARLILACAWLPNSAVPVITTSCSWAVPPTWMPFGKSVLCASSSVWPPSDSGLIVAPVAMSSRPLGVTSKPSSLLPLGTTRPPAAEVK